MSYLLKENTAFGITNVAEYFAQYACEYERMQEAFNEFDPTRADTFLQFYTQINEGFIQPVILGNKNIVMRFYEDGVGRSGKTSLNKVLENLDFRLFSTGYYYRALTKYAVDHEYDLEDPKTLQNFEYKLKSLSFTLEEVIDERGKKEIFIVITERKGKTFRYSVDTDLNDPAVTCRISYIGGLSFVAEKLDYETMGIVNRERLIAVDSRDNYLRRELIETSLAGQALAGGNIEVLSFYVYVCAALEERARRESLRPAKLGKQKLPVEEIARQLDARDKGDAGRDVGKLLLPRKARESGFYDFFLDTTRLNIEESQLLLLTAAYAHFFPDAGKVILDSLQDYFRKREEYYEVLIILRQTEAEEEILQQEDQNDLKQQRLHRVNGINGFFPGLSIVA